MSNFTVAEINDAIENDEEWDGWYAVSDGGPATISLRGEDVELTRVKDFGGEGMGDDRWVVFKAGDQLFKKTGYYTSHDGSYWDGDLREVRAE